MHAYRMINDRAALSCGTCILLVHRKTKAPGVVRASTVGGVNCRGKMTDIIFVIRPSRREASGKLFQPETCKPHPRRRRSCSRNPFREIARDGNFVGIPLSKLSQLCQFANCRLACTSACHSAIVIKLYDTRNVYLYIC